MQGFSRRRPAGRSSAQGANSSLHAITPASRDQVLFVLRCCLLHPWTPHLPAIQITPVAFFATATRFRSLLAGACPAVFRQGGVQCAAPAAQHMQSHRRHATRRLCVRSLVGGPEDATPKSNQDGARSLASQCDGFRDSPEGERLRKRRALYYSCTERTLLRSEVLWGRRSALRGIVVK